MTRLLLSLALILLAPIGVSLANADIQLGQQSKPPSPASQQAEEPVNVESLLKLAIQTTQTLTPTNKSIKGEIEENLTRLWQVNLRKIAISQARKGDAPGALRTVSRLRQYTGDPYGQAIDLQSISEALLRSGDALSALKVVEPIPEIYPQAKPAALAYIACVQTSMGNPAARETFEKALQASSKSYDGLFNDLVPVARFQAEAGDKLGNKKTLQLAIQVALAIKDDYLIADAMILIGKEQAASGDQTGSEQTFLDATRQASKIFVLPYKADAFGRIAMAQIERGNRAAAAQTFQQAILDAEPIPHKHRNPYLSNIAHWQIKAGQYETVAKTLQIIKQNALSGKKSAVQDKANRGIPPWAGDMLTLAILAGMAGYPDMANAAVEAIEEDRWKSLAARNLMSAFVNTKKKPGVEQAIRALSERVTQITVDPEYRTEMLTNIAVTLAGAGNLKEALRTAQNIDDKNPSAASMKDWAFQSMAEILIQKGDLQGAVTAIHSIKDDRLNGDELRKVAKAQAQRGQAKQALDWSAEQSSPLARANILLGVAEGILAPEEFKPFVLTPNYGH